MTLKDYISVLYDINSKLEIAIESVNETLIFNKTASELNYGSPDLVGILRGYLDYYVMDTILNERENRLFLRIAP